MSKGAQKPALDPEVEARVAGLLGAVKRARDLDALRSALVAVAQGGEAGAEAMRRLQPPFKTFGGAPPGNEQALSWDRARLLVADEGLESAQIISRGASVAAPARDDAPANEPVDTPPGADPKEVRAALIEALKAQKAEVLRVQVSRVSGGQGRVVLYPLEGPKKVLYLDAEAWMQPTAEIVAGIVEAMAARD